MKTSNQIQRNSLTEVFQQLVADIRKISEGDCQWAIADIDHHFQDQRVRIQYTVKPLIAEHDNGEELPNGGMKG
jgi:hypothetical protein